MPDFRIDETASEHAKMRAAGPAAVGLWAMAGSYSMRPDVLSDGWIPLHYVMSWPNGKRLAMTLVGVGLWREQERNGLVGYQFHDWLGYQRSAAKVQSDREAARTRMARNRSDGVRANTTRTNPATRTEHTDEPRPNFNRSSATSLPPSPVGGSFRGDRPVSNRAREERPPERCPKHLDDPDPPNCGKCADQRKAVEKWDQQRHLDERLTIRACGLCDGDGYRLVPGRRIVQTPYVRCDHTREALT